jgi:hypothetical protein
MGFDLDGVLVDLMPEILIEGQKLGMIPRDVTLAEIEGNIEVQFDIGEDNMSRILTLGLFRRAKPIQPAVKDVRRWIEEGADVYYITARNEDRSPGLHDVCRDWLDEHGIYEGSRNCIHSRSIKKWEVAKDLKLDVFVDDFEKVIGPMKKVVPHCFLVAAAHNADFEGPERMTWSEIREKIDSLLLSKRS